MQSWLGQHIVWYMYGYECFGGECGSFVTSHQMMEAVVPGQIVCAHHSY